MSKKAFMEKEKKRWDCYELWSKLIRKHSLMSPTLIVELSFFPKSQRTFYFNLKKKKISVQTSDYAH
jgi:hypothetical protein